ncbi:hypothetical protein WICPIJ_004471 [Wickerhamomyces pijperi]|uniref:Uncharacterized protein n=1 Tax=Wickerhamomyces pijperi TaxID=599730 RepID=A0A9P8Q5V0_WICPI|nr:hypothetical protein WICPIJ_004471 [Wickerhamomyces pijperi]
MYLNPSSIEMKLPSFPTQSAEEIYLSSTGSDCSSPTTPSLFELVVFFDILNGIVLICLIFVLLVLIWRYYQMVNKSRRRPSKIVAVDDLEKALEL